MAGALSEIANCMKLSSIGTMSSISRGDRQETALVWSLVTGQCYITVLSCSHGDWEL